MLRTPIAILTAGGGLIRYHKTKLYHFLVVKSGVLYRSGWMRPDTLERTIRKYGIKTVVNLCLPTEDTYRKNYVDEQQICQMNRAKLINLPLQGNTPPSKEQVAEWLRLLSNNENLPILAHCAQGVMRTNIMMAVYKIECLHEENELVLSELPTFGHKLYVPKRKIMRDFILNYKPSQKAEREDQEDVMGALFHKSDVTQ